MELHLSHFLPCLYAFLGGLAFAVPFNVHGKDVPLAALGGAGGWLVYLLALPLCGSEVISYFVAALALSLYSEMMARIRKRPVTTFLLISIFPLVPGAGIYYTMQYAIQGNSARFLSQGMHTLGLSGALALGILLVSTVMRMWQVFRRRSQERS